MGRGIGRAAVVLATAGSLAVATPANAADTVIEGCNERLAGEIGIRELVGDVGDTLAVAVTVHSLNDIDAFALDVAFPVALLSHVRTDPGDLTAGFFEFRGDYDSTSQVVRPSGFDVNPIPSGSVGELAVLWFEVIAAGNGSLSTSAYVDDIRSQLGYVSCESQHGTSPVDALTWGRVKARYSGKTSRNAMP